MSFWGSLFGETKSNVWDPGPAPALGYQDQRDAIAKRASDFLTDPYSTKDYAQFRTALGDALAPARSQVLDEVYKMYSQPGGAGLRSGAADRAKLGAETQLGKAAASATVDWVSQARQEALSSFLSSMQIEANYNLGGYNARNQGIQRWSTTNKGYIGDVFGAIGQFWGGGNSSAYSGIAKAIAS